VTVKFLLDANTSRALAHALARHAPELDVLRLQDTALAEAQDPEVLEFAAAEGRIVVSRDKRTLRDFALERVQAGGRMPGLLLVRRPYLDRQAGIGVLVDELKLIAGASAASEWEGVIQFIPFLAD
jgi:predicted nuclease of predicted toxin-antitoxin system